MRAENALLFWLNCETVCSFGIRPAEKLSAHHFEATHSKLCVFCFFRWFRTYTVRSLRVFLCIPFVRMCLWCMTFFEFVHQLRFRHQSTHMFTKTECSRVVLFLSILNITEFKTLRAKEKLFFNLNKKSVLLTLVLLLIVLM